MKTNHRRNFVEKRKCRQNTLMSMVFSGVLKTVEIGSPKKIGANHPGFDHSNGHRGTANAKRGAKKFVRTRLRFHENHNLKKIINLVGYSEESK